MKTVKHCTSLGAHLKEIFPFSTTSSTTPSVFSAFLRKTWFPLAAACLEIDPCRSKVCLVIPHNFFIWLTILATCKLQTVFIKIVMTSCYAALVPLEGRKVLSEYGLSTGSIYIGLELSESFGENIIKEKREIC